MVDGTPASPEQRKGRHVRSQAFASSSAQGRTSAVNVQLVPPSALGLPVGVDPHTLDADEAFVRFSVRDVQSIEASLQTSCDTLTARLRLLVSERYRDMLGTANTLIDMGTSSSNLVRRLDGVLESVQRADANDAQGAKVGLTGLVRTNDVADVRQDADRQRELQQQQQSELFALAASTKLIAEAPDEVWRAIESALQATDGKGNVSSRRNTLKGRELSNFQSATTMRAAWIYTLAETSWSWLVAQKTTNGTSDTFDAEKLFPYIVRQRSALLSMRTYILNAATQGLSGFVEAASEGLERQKWENVSPSYLSTITSILTLTLLHGSSFSQAREELLRKRKESLSAHVQQQHGRSSDDVDRHALAHIVRFVADTLLYTLRAFALPCSADVAEPHLATLFARLSRADENSQANEQFPPNAVSVLLTLPSSTFLAQYLPSAVRAYTPTLMLEEDNVSDKTVHALREWIKEVDEQILRTSLSGFVDRLTTIASIGDVQGAVWEAFDLCVAQARTTCGAKGDHLASLVEHELHSLVQRIDALLTDRFTTICRASGEELSSVVMRGMRDAFAQLHGSGGSNVEEGDPVHFVFETNVTSSANVDVSLLEALERKMRVRTQYVQGILTLAEERVTSFAREIKMYTSTLRRAERRREKRARNAVNGTLTTTTTTTTNGRGRGDAIEGSFGDSMRLARMSIVRELKNLIDDVLQAKEYDATTNLFLARLASALCHSRLLDVKTEHITDGGDFQQTLRTLQHSLLAPWASHVVREAIGVLGQRKTTVASVDRSGPSSVSAPLLGALAVLSRACQSVGLGYRSETIWLRSLLLREFCSTWLRTEQVAATADRPQNDNEEQAQRAYDIEVLLLLLGPGDLNAEHKRAVDELTSAEAKSISSTQYTSDSWQSHVTEHLPSAILRTRLILAGLAVDEVSFAKAIERSGDANDRTRSITAQAVPPLPMLHLVKHGSERVPRVQLTATSVVTSAR